MTKFKVVRTYEREMDTDLLQQAFDDGWQFVRASEYVPTGTYNHIIRYGYIEYILCKKVGDTDGNS